MAAPRTTTWKLEPHTAAKHEILRKYLQAWLPILSQGKFPKLVFVDGFSGPGRYANGEEGSPLIAINALIEQPKPIEAAVDFHFIELDANRADHLTTEIAALRLPRNVSTKIHRAQSFQDAFPQIWEEYSPEKTGRPRPPSFVFIDPFGFNIPFSHVQRVLRQKSCEVLINFMFEEINRFLSHEQLPKNFDELFGCTGWQEGNEIREPKQRIKFLHDLYQRQLQTAGASFVRSFSMRNRHDAMDYMLFFGTNSELGLRKMKEAMWRVDESGTYSFSDATDPNQTVLFAKEPDRKFLEKLIREKFSGKEIGVNDIENFVVRDTSFRETHYKKVLQALEKGGLISVTGFSEKRRSGTFADPGIKIRFVEK